MLEITEIVKTNSGVDTLGGLSLSIHDGGIYGILTVDDNAKNALAELICGCEDAENGQININGETMSRTATELKKKVRLVPQRLELDKSTTPVEYMDFVGQALSVDADRRYRQIKEALDLLAIEDIQNKPFSSLDSVSALRLSLAASLIGNPDVIVLNDPFGGIDAKSLDKVFETVAMLGKIKTLVLISKRVAHVKALCSDMAIICNGRVALDGNISQIEAKINSTRELQISVRGEYERISSVIEGMNGIVSVKQISSDKNNVNVIRVEHKPDTKIKDRLFSALSEIGAPMLSFKQIELTLEDVFYSLTEKDRERIDEQSIEIESKSRKGGRRK